MKSLGPAGLNRDFLDAIWNQQASAVFASIGDMTDALHALTDRLQELDGTATGSPRFISDRLAVEFSKNISSLQVRFR